MFPNIRFMQYISALTACLSLTICGMGNSWSSPSLIKLSGDDSPLGRPITVEEGSWIVSVLLLAPAMLAWPVAWMLNTFGRKNTLLFAAVPFLIGWVMLIFARSVEVIYAARCISGMGAAFSNIGAAMYIGEIADKDIRGRLGTGFNLMRLLGSIFVLSVGPFVSFRALAAICSVVPVIFFVCFYFTPESPYYLVKKGKINDAIKVLGILSPQNCSKEEVHIKLKSIQESVDKDMQNSTSYFSLFHKDVRMSLVVMLGIKSMQQLSGAVAIDAYMQTIITDLKVEVPAEIMAIIFSLVQLPPILLTSAIVDKMGRKPILIISAVGCALGEIMLGSYCYLQIYSPDIVSNWRWMPLLGCCIFAILANFGLFTLPYIIVGEIFPINVKEIASSINIIYGIILAFIVSKFFMPLSAAWGRHNVLWLFASACLLGALFVYFIVPETKDKQFIQIQDELNGKLKWKKKQETN